MLTALLVIGILVLLIVVHECGHFIAAKLSGVKVEEFGVGYPPRALTFGTFGGTEYTLNWIPFGGFVRLFGDDGDARHGRGSLMDSPRWKQAIILAACVAMNALAAWMLLAVALHIGVPQSVAEILPGESARLIVSDVVSESPALSAGITPGDEILGMADGSGERIIDTLTPASVIAFVRDHAGEPLDVSYKSNGIEKNAVITPAQGVLSDLAGQPALGIALVLVANRSVPWGVAMGSAFFNTLDSFRAVATNLWHLLAGAVGGRVNLSQIVGPVGIVSYVGAASQNGIGAVLALASVISVNLAIINLIPIPALDGGRLAILAIEAMTRRNAPLLAMRALNTLGIALIIVLMLVVTYHDIGRLLA